MSCKSLNNTSNKVILSEDYTNSNIEEDTLMYRINKMTVYGGAYIIQAAREDSVYYILTQNDLITNSLCKEQIREGERYALKLLMFYPEYEAGEGRGKILGGTVDGIIYYKTLIPFREFPGVCYTTKSLKGLCLLKDYGIKVSVK
jgi:hypothetical protein